MIVQHIHVNGVRFGVVTSGEVGQRRGTLVLLHGFTGSASGWSGLLAELARTGWRIIALDMLGHGQSDAPADPARYTMEHCQQDIIAVLRELSVNEGEAILLGYSMGGRIALYCAFSGFFRALILESASPGLADAAEREQRRSSDLALAESIEREGIEAFVERWENLPLFATQHNLPAEQRAALHAQRLNNRPAGLANSLRGVGTGEQPALHHRLPELTIPVLLLAGELDAKFCAIARQMAQALPHAQLSIVPEAGHTIHLERPAAFMFQTLNWIEQVTNSCRLPGGGVYYTRKCQGEMLW
ncbi:MAG TPA: 2-succinyl-6-hydroxy-2,4-cyclohexadiene-1-carboxylate synthase [Ktedonosporobacter sp.]|nr:2-succinyl-6-hydroxy-2,4-cyclohexadiene-1-carboxylate synthase [Ktedonosporobacter sp.]